MNVLITGATGFIGFHLVDALLKSNKKLTIYAMARRAEGAEHLRQLGRLHIVYGSLSDVFSLKSCVQGMDKIKRNFDTTH